MDYVYQIGVPNSQDWIDVPIQTYNQYIGRFGYRYRVLYGIDLSPFDLWWESLNDSAKEKFNKSDAMIAFNAGVDSK